MPETEMMPRCPPMQEDRIRIAIATEEDRATIYRLRHSVYARELRQHPENTVGELTDPLDPFNLYIVAERGGEVAGFVSVTPPGRSYSIDKYLTRGELPFPCDGGLYEVRLLTVLPEYRQSTLGAELAGLLIYAAFRWVEAAGGRRVVIIGRRELLGLYRKVGLQPLGRQIQSGAVTFELMSATLAELRRQVPRYADLLRYVAPQVEWQLGMPYEFPVACAHGGAFFEAIGVEFDHLERRRTIINADVLDAWFPPAPAVTAALREDLPWILGTSPPADGAGLVSTIARVRGVAPECVLPGAGSSALVFLALRHWLTPASRVLLLDPTYGEYLHVCRQVVGCAVDRLALRREDGYRLDPDALGDRLSAGYDLVVLVNPNNPTGQHLPRESLEAVLRSAPARTRVWVDEAYVDYVGAGASLERFAAGTPNVAVCKSLSKGYALSGVRAAYLCAGSQLLEELRLRTPPWAVSLPAQVAAVLALQAPDYYAACYRETHLLRASLFEGLRVVCPRMEVVPGTANFVLCHLPEEGPDAAAVVSQCQARGLFLRDVSGTGTALGRHTVRIAIKGEEVQGRILDILEQVLHPSR